MKILYKSYYIGRDIFVIEKDNKIIKVYRSSGLSGTGHCGQILPFSRLNDNSVGTTYTKCNPGYIYKEMFYKNMWLNHKKEIYKYPGVKQFMDEIQEFLKNNYPKKHKKIQTVNDIIRHAKRINKKMDFICKDKEYLDLYEFDLKIL